MTILGHEYEQVEAESVNLFTMIRCERFEKVIREGTEKLFDDAEKDEKGKSVPLTEDSRKNIWLGMCGAWREFVKLAFKNGDESLADLNKIPAFKTTEVLQSFFTLLRTTQNSVA